ncbi:hypothetical protein NFHSH190041_21880 [Shewanella sp. NFH-SH190041]|nr:hypothetical protein NFHSH190041_21880 [Shewanella sp. NFH-SH190041]
MLPDITVLNARNRASLCTQSGVIMEVEDYENAYYQVQDDVIESLPVEMDEEAFLD